NGSGGVEGLHDGSDDRLGNDDLGGRQAQREQQSAREEARQQSDGNDPFDRRLSPPPHDAHEVIIVARCLFVKNVTITVQGCPLPRPPSLPPPRLPLRASLGTSCLTSLVRADYRRPA